MLRTIYEQELGKKVSDRTWIRVKGSLYIWDECDEGLGSIVRRAAQIRKGNPSKRITRSLIAFELNVENAFPVGFAPITGRELYEHVCQAVGKRVSRQTIYRWGREIRCQFSMKALYDRHHLVIWAAKLFPYYQDRDGKFT